MNPERRRLLQSLGGLGVTAVIAGCTGGDSGQADGDETETEGDGGSDATDASSGGDSGSDGDTWNVGVLLPFTGTYDWVGADIFPVADMIVQEINDNGGIAGRPVNLIQADTEATVDASVTATQKLINSDNVRAVIGPTSLTYTGTIDIFQQEGVVSVSPPGSTTELNDVGGEYQFRTVPSDSLGGRAIARAARDQSVNRVTTYERMAVMSGQAPALQAFKRPVTSSFEEFSGTIVENMDFSVEQASYQSEISQVLDSDPEIITLVGTPEDSAKILNAAFQAGYEGNWFFTQDQTNDAFIDDVDEQLTEGAFGLKDAVSQEAVESGRIEQFKNDFREFAGRETGFFAENTYDATNVVMLAMKRAVMQDKSMPRQAIADSVPEIANPPGETVRNYQEGAQPLEDGEDINYQGLSGPIDFDENGNVLASFEILQAQAGAWESIGRVTPEDLE